MLYNLGRPWTPPRWVMLMILMSQSQGGVLLCGDVRSFMLNESCLSLK